MTIVYTCFTILQHHLQLIIFPLSENTLQRYTQTLHNFSYKLLILCVFSSTLLTDSLTATQFPRQWEKQQHIYIEYHWSCIFSCFFYLIILTLWYQLFLFGLYIYVQCGRGKSINIWYHKSLYYFWSNFRV